MINIARAKVKVKSETDTGLNNIVNINGIDFTNTQAYDKAKKGNVEGFHGVINKDGTKFIRSNPNKSKKDNLG